VPAGRKGGVGDDLQHTFKYLRENTAPRVTGIGLSLENEGSDSVHCY